MPIYSEAVIVDWNKWEIRALLLLSLLLQVILVAFGSARKCSARIWIRLLVWSAYMSADLVATVALGVLARKVGGQPDPKDSIQFFWTPFLILHLGGADTITAYSLEDTELWPRHFLGLLVQTVVAIYVFVKSWGYDRLKFIAIPVFIAGIIKYGERTSALRTSSTKIIRKHLLSPDPGPDYAKDSRETKNNVDVKQSPRNVFPQRDSESPDNYPPPENYPSQAYFLFKRLKYLYADLILGYNEQQVCHSMISSKSPKVAFELVEGELGLLYDMLYTKATIRCSKHVVWSCSASVFCGFAVISFAFFVAHPFSPIDISITYLLLVGAIALEVYALVLHILSDWTKIWLVKYFKKARIGKRWSRTISKYNLIKFCLRKQTTMWIRFQKLLGIEEIVEKHLNVDWQVVDAKLQELIFKQLKERSDDINKLIDVNSCKELLSYRGDCVLNKMNCTQLKWSTSGVEFDHSLLVWHIATQLCYYDDVEGFQGTRCPESPNEYSKISKCLSEYMLYLLIMYPNMLPKGIGEIRYQDTCSEATRFFELKKIKRGTNAAEACKKLYEVEVNIESLEKVKENKTKSVLFYGCKLAQELQYLEQQQELGRAQKWEMISKVWVELLAYAAVNCGWREHGQQLRGGGELLTHVCLLMAHLGLSEQYQIQKDYFQIREDRWWCLYACNPCS